MAAILISKWWTTDHEEKDATYIFMTLRHSSYNIKSQNPLRLMCTREVTQLLQYYESPMNEKYQLIVSQRITVESYDERLVTLDSSESSKSEYERLIKNIKKQ